jgi:hypothetical protein
MNLGLWGNGSVLLPHSRLKHVREPLNERAWVTAEWALVLDNVL